MIPWLLSAEITCPNVLLVVADESHEFFDTAAVYKFISAVPAPVEEAADVKAAETVSSGSRAMSIE